MHKKTIIIFSVATAVMIYIMGSTGAPLKTTATPLGILNAEFAYNNGKAAVVYNAWNEDNRLNAAYRNTYWDFIFLICYSGLLNVLCLWVKSKIKNRQWQQAATILSKLAFVAALFDIVENIFMFTIFSNHFNSMYLTIMFVFSVLKWILVAFIILFLLLSFIRIGISKK